MAHGDRFDTDVPRYFGLYFAYVRSNVDPEGRDRVKVEIPGFLEPESRWAFCCMPGAGAERRGIKAPYKVGSLVCVMFEQGDPEVPIIMGGISVPEQAGVATGVSPERLTNVFAISMGRFSIVIDANDDAPVMYLRDEGVEGETNPVLKDPMYIVFDGAKRALTVKGQVALSLTSDGLLDLTGTPIRVARRAVLDNGKPI